MVTCAICLYISFGHELIGHIKRAEFIQTRFRSLADMNFQPFTIRFHARCRFHCIAKQTEARHMCLDFGIHVTILFLLVKLWDFA